MVTYAGIPLICRGDLRMSSHSEKKGQIKMKEFTYVIKEELGMHPRPARLLLN